MWLQQQYCHHMYCPTILQERCIKKNPRPYQRLSAWWRSSTWHSKLQLPCHHLWWTWCQVMTHVLFVARKSIFDITALMHSATSTTVFIILPRTAQRKFPHQEYIVTMTNHALTDVIITTTDTGQTPFITDVASRTTLTGQDHTIDLNVTEAPVTTGNMHPTLYPTFAAACNIHPKTHSRRYSHRDMPNHHRCN